MKWRITALALAALLALAFLSQGAQAPFQKDEETQPASIVANLMHGGSWLLPRDAYGFLSRKPPLYYWLEAGALEVLGIPLSEASARAVAIVAGTGLATLVVAVTAEQFGAVAGLLAFLFALGSYGLVERAAHARTDMLFTFLTFAAYCVIYPMAESGGGGSGRCLAAGLLLAAAVLTKGPLAIVLCGLAVALYLLACGKNPLAAAGQRWPWLTLLPAVLIPALWYVPAIIASHGQLGLVIMQENLGHFLPASLGGTGEAAHPLYHIFARFLGSSLPFGLYIPALLWAGVRLRKRSHALLYQLSFLVAVLGLFTIASAKRDAYILPAMPPFAIALAALFTSLGDEQLTIRLRNAATWLGALGFLAAEAALAALVLAPMLTNRLMHALHASDRDYLQLFIHHLRQPYESACLAAIAIFALAALASQLRKRPRLAAGALALAAMAGVSLWVGQLRPELAGERTYKNFATQMRRLTGGATVYSAAYPDYEISYYYGRALPPLRSLEQLPKRGTHYALVWEGSRDAKQHQAGKLLLSSNPVPGERRLELLKIGKVWFESRRTTK